MIRFPVRCNHLIHALATLGLVGFLGSGCDKSDNPDAITLKNLKYPNRLTITDEGSGTVRLTWTASNYEDDFDGYNIYGLKGTASSLNLKEGEALQLLDSDGNSITTAKDALQAMSYNGKDLETAGTQPKEKGKYSFYPIYTADKDSKPVLPTCSPRAGGSCESPNTEGEIQKPFNGTTSYTVKGLIPGTSYCFLVFSTQDDGEEVSQTSSPVTCITPKFALNIGMKADANTSGLKSVGFHFDAIAEECAQSACPDLSTFTASSTYLVGSSTVATSASELPLYVESISSELWFTSGAPAVLSDLGYLENGFEDEKLPRGREVPTLTSATLSALENPQGFSVPGQSLRIEKHHMYLLAIVASEKISYHWLWVKDAATEGTAFTVEARLGAQTIDPSAPQENI